MDFEDLIPFLIPLIIAQLVLLGYTLWHILTHPHYKRGSRLLWIAVSVIGMQFWGPIVYFLFGKEDV
ncbi:PLDc N-terminal domain-containing protein [Cuneatibacter caecimuris]|uniref:Phospholipase D-like protein n=1 Tax=Cuneatibacter caecimuris TaxID=1796618 RepID=A0A4Q7PQK5_9FIRM|nr:PLDc N-terminal domain-containing protein [Cuneatibacter caecimuris]RZT02606.1 phospholipase D-like protein [Cuneatibacter caecimuris]